MALDTLVLARESQGQCVVSWKPQITLPAAIHHDPTCPALNAHRVIDCLGRELWAVGATTAMPGTGTGRWRGIESHTAMTRSRRTRRGGTTSGWGGAVPVRAS